MLVSCYSSSETILDESTMSPEAFYLYAFNFNCLLFISLINIFSFVPSPTQGQVEKKREPERLLSSCIKATGGEDCTQVVAMMKCHQVSHCVRE